MSKITLNIGLNVGANEPSDQLGITLTEVAKQARIENVAIVTGEWGGVVERCAVIVVRRRLSRPIDFATLCVVLAQDAIAFSEGGEITLFNKGSQPEKGDASLFHYDTGAHSVRQPE